VKVRVLVKPKEGILDPQGQAIERTLPALGYDTVRSVHVGRLIELELNGTDGDTVTSQVNEMCERLLANPLVESYEIEQVAE